MTQARIGNSVTRTGGAHLSNVAGREPGQRAGAACALGTLGRNPTRLSAVRKLARRYPYSRSCGAILGACGAGGEGMMRSSIGTPSWTTASSIRIPSPRKPPPRVRIPVPKPGVAILWLPCSEPLPSRPAVARHRGGVTAAAIRMADFPPDATSSLSLIRPFILVDSLSSVAPWTNTGGLARGPGCEHCRGPAGHSGESCESCFGPRSRRRRWPLPPEPGGPHRAR